jgi:hypothetical protein
MPRPATKSQCPYLPGTINVGNDVASRRQSPLTPSSTTMPPKSTSSSVKDSTAHAFNKLLNQPRPGSKSRSGEVDDGTKRLRRMILVEGIPSKAVGHPTFRPLTQDPTLRPRIWKILLRVNEIPTDTYLRYIAKGPCEVREKIRNDTFR